jgi:hypothetical protein
MPQCETCGGAFAFHELAAPTRETVERDGVTVKSHGRCLACLASDSRTSAIKRVELLQRLGRWRALARRLAGRLDRAGVCHGAGHVGVVCETCLVLAEFERMEVED